MLPKRIAIKTMGIWILFVVVATMAWQVAPALAGFTPTPEPPTATFTAEPPTATFTAGPPLPTATATAGPGTATATVGPGTATVTVGPGTATPTAGLSTATPTLATAQPTRTTPENTPEMPTTGGQVSGLSSSGIGVVLLLGMMALLIVAIGLVARQVTKTKTKV